MITDIAYPLNDQIGKIQLLSYMGNDLSIVNDAKASFGNESSEMGSKEKRLLRYLIEHKHNSPLRGVVFKFKITAPLSTCRQWWKHVVASNHTESQLQHNEMSFRYVEIDNPQFYIPSVFYNQSSSNKQGSGEPLNKNMQEIARYVYEKACRDSASSYTTLIEAGVSREVARNVLVPAVYTTWVWTTSLESLINFVKLRRGVGAQSEIQLYAKELEYIMRYVVPYTCEVLFN